MNNFFDLMTSWTNSSIRPSLLLFNGGTFSMTYNYEMLAIRFLI